jgi:hypothetical protein
MINSLLTFFKFLLYSESNFSVKKLDLNNYFVCAKNGLNAEISITDRVMFVKAWSTVDYVAFYYCTPMLSTDNSVDDFVITNIQNSIMFALPKKQLIEYFDSHSLFFNRFSTREFPVIFVGVSSSNKSDDTYTYDFIRLNSVRYPIIYFTKKKIIRNVFKYQLNAINRKDKSIVKNIAYYVGDVLVYLSDIDSFYKSNVTKESAQKMRFGWMSGAYSNYVDDQSQQPVVGFQNQLFEHNEIGTKHLNLNKIHMLKTKKDQFCLFTKNKKQLLLSYVELFNVNGQTTVNLTTLSYSKGRVNKKIKPVDFDIVKQHEMDISTGVMMHIDTFKLTHPSENIINSLHKFDISTKLPLNPDDLLILDMCQV